MSEVGCDIVEYLKEFHTSEGKAVKARELCVLFNVHEKQLRNIVSDLRQNERLYVALLMVTGTPEIQMIYPLP